MAVSFWFGGRVHQKLFLSILVLSSAVYAQGQRSEGVRPKPQSREYASQVDTGSVTYAASVVPAEQVKQRFVSDISKAYLVIEIGCYPNGAAPVEIRTDDFTIRPAVKADPVLPVEADVVAALVERRDPGPKTTPVYVGASVGYESGNDPYTGRRVHTVYTGAEAGVSGPASPNSYPADSPRNRAVLEDQLWHRSLPEGPISTPVAGYLYFPLSLLKKEKGFYLVSVESAQGGTPGSPQHWELRVPVAKK